jgi:hypothetical protein
MKIELDERQIEAVAELEALRREALLREALTVLQIRGYQFGPDHMATCLNTAWKHCVACEQSRELSHAIAVLDRYVKMTEEDRIKTVAAIQRALGKCRKGEA